MLRHFILILTILIGSAPFQSRSYTFSWILIYKESAKKSKIGVWLALSSSNK